METLKMLMKLQENFNYGEWIDLLDEKMQEILKEINKKD